jgi:hypothetical protein
LHLLNQTLYEALIRPPHCRQLQLFLLANPSFYLYGYSLARPPAKVNILVLKNISISQSSSVALAKLVWKGKELLEIVRELFEGELNNLLLL